MMGLGRVPLDGYDTYMYVYHPSLCFYYGGAVCDESFRCCKSKLQINFVDNNPNYWLVQGTWNLYDEATIDPPCPPTCSPICDYYLTEENPCDIPCNYGEWEPGTQTLSFNYYGCTIEYTYEMRTVQCDGNVYNDYRVIEIIIPPGCYWEEEILMALLTENLLINGDHSVPDFEGECITNYRIINSACWELTFDPTQYVEANPCEDEGCCFSSWKICLVNGEYEITLLSNMMLGSCETQGCQVMCAEYPPSVIASANIDEERDFDNKVGSVEVAPNPTNGDIKFKIHSVEKGFFEISIFDNLGNELISKTIEASGHGVESTISMIDYTNGVYYYKIFISGTEFCTGTFVVSK